MKTTRPLFTYARVIDIFDILPRWLRLFRACSVVPAITSAIPFSPGESLYFTNMAASAIGRPPQRAIFAAGQPRTLSGGVSRLRHFCVRALARRRRPRPLDLKASRPIFSRT
jgi:hypothetical protein